MGARRQENANGHSAAFPALGASNPRLFEIERHCLTVVKISLQRSLQGGGQHQRQAQVRKTRSRPPGGAEGGWGRRKMPSFQFTQRLPSLLHPPCRESLFRPQPPPRPHLSLPSPSAIACNHTDCFKNQLRLLRVSGPAHWTMVGCTN